MSDLKRFLDSVQFVQAVDQLKASFAAAQDMISGWAIQGVQEAMVNTKGTPFTEMSRHDKLSLLATSVDWERYTSLGLDQHTPLRIMFNAVDGKPPEQWLHQTPEEAGAMREELGGYANAVQMIKQATQDRDFEQSLTQAASRGKTQEKDRGIDRE